MPKPREVVVHARPQEERPRRIIREKSTGRLGLVLNQKDANGVVEKNVMGETDALFVRADQFKISELSNESHVGPPPSG